MLMLLVGIASFAAGSGLLWFCISRREQIQSRLSSSSFLDQAIALTFTAGVTFGALLIIAGLMQLWGG